MSKFSDLINKLDFTPNQIKQYFKMFEMAGYLDKETFWVTLNNIYPTEKAKTIYFKLEPYLNNTINIDNVLTKIEELSIQNTLTEQDILALILYLSQTAFNRESGMERAQLQVLPKWMEGSNKEYFIQAFKELNIINELKTDIKKVDIIAILGATAGSMVEFIKYTKSIIAPNIKFDTLYFLTGQRELTVGLDSDLFILELASFLNLPYNKDMPFIEKGNPKKIVLNSPKTLTETDAANYLLKRDAKELFSKIRVIDSKQNENGARPTTVSNAQDFYNDLLALGKFKAKTCKVILLGRQPYISRQVVNFNNVLTQKSLESNIELKIEIYPAGDKAKLENSELLSIFSETAILMNEHYNKAVIEKKVERLPLEQSKVIMFNTRKEALKNKHETINLNSERSRLENMLEQSTDNKVSL
ncbi:MAG: hypothetical protein J0H68_07430 [Sphingobacteriia bacterium]|nr:hypothetical protein [Sphingobacteriia bacterium]